MHVIVIKLQFAIFLSRSCPNLHYIPEFVHTTPQAGHNQQAQQNIKKAISKLEELVKSKQKVREDTKEVKSSCLKEIKALREEINEILDQLEKASVDEVEETFAQLDKNFQDELNQMQEMLDKLAKCRTSYQLSQNNPSQNFVSTKVSEKVISESEHVVASTNNEKRSLPRFAKNKIMLNFLHDMKSLGKTRQLKRNNLYKIISEESFSVKLDSDPSDCNIWSSCILDSGDILLADYDNNNIKLLDGKTYKVRHSLKMSAAPRSVCRVGSKEAAVSLNNKTVQFVSTENELLPARSTNFDHDCRGIAAIDGQILVCEYGPKAYIYTKDGKRLKTLEKDNVGKALFGKIREVCMSDDGKKIQLVDQSKAVLTIDIDGNVIWKYCDPELKGAWGICTDGTGNLLASGKSSNNVIQIGLDGEKKGEVIPKSYGLKFPTAVCFDIENLKLIVACGNKVHVFLVE